MKEPSPLPKDVQTILDNLEFAASRGKDVFNGLLQLRMVLNAEFRARNTPTHPQQAKEGV